MGVLSNFHRDDIFDACIVIAMDMAFDILKPKNTGHTNQINYLVVMAIENWRYVSTCPPDIYMTRPIVTKKTVSGKQL